MPHEILTAIRGQDSGARFSMRGRGAVAARDGDADILLSDSAVGSARIVFSLRNRRLWAEPRDGRAELNGRRFTHPAALRAGDVVSFGPAAYEVLWAGDAAPPAREGSVASREAAAHRDALVEAPPPTAVPSTGRRGSDRNMTGTAMAGFALIAAGVAVASLLGDFVRTGLGALRIWDVGLDGRLVVGIPALVGLLAAARWSLIGARRPRRSRLLALVVMVCGAALVGAAFGLAAPALGTESEVSRFFGREAGEGFWALAGAGAAMIVFAVIGRRGNPDALGRVRPELMAAVLVAAGGAFGAAAAAAGAGLSWVSVGPEDYGGFGPVVVSGRFVLPAAFILLALAIGCLALVATPFARAARPLAAGVAVMGAAILGLALGWIAGIPLPPGASLGPGVALAVIGGSAALLGGLAGSLSFEVLDPIDDEELAV